MYIRAADRRNDSHSAGLPTIRAMVSRANVDMAFAFLVIWASYCLSRRAASIRRSLAAETIFYPSAPPFLWVLFSIGNAQFPLGVI